MLKNKKSEISKALSALQTKRRIALTGTPLQNNLTEYYRMADWIKPGCLGSETSFESKFSNPIMDSLVVSSKTTPFKDISKHEFSYYSLYFRRTHQRANRKRDKNC
jgi:transcriptional regulator ATRX